MQHEWYWRATRNGWVYGKIHPSPPFYNIPSRQPEEHGAQASGSCRISWNQYKRWRLEGEIRYEESLIFLYNNAQRGKEQKGKWTTMKSMFTRSVNAASWTAKEMGLVTHCGVARLYYGGKDMKICKVPRQLTVLYFVLVFNSVLQGVKMPRL
jgi:hypothetical protein